MCFLLTGCVKEQPNKENNPALGKGDVNDLLAEQPGEDVLASINGQDIKEEDLNEYLPVLRYIYQKNPEDDDWSSFMAYAVQYYASAKIYSLKMEELGLSIDEDKLQDAFDNVANATNDPEEFYEEIAQYDISEDQIKDFLKGEQEYNVLYEYVTKDITVEDEEISSYYEENKSGFTDVNSRDFHQILFEDKDSAQAALSEILDGRKTFEDIAAEHKAELNGYMATVAEGELIDPFEDIVWELDEDEVYSSVVESDLGYHIVTAKNFVNNKTYSLDELRENISKYVLDQKKSEAMNTFITECVSEYAVSIYYTGENTGTGIPATPETPTESPKINIAGED